LLADAVLSASATEMYSVYEPDVNLHFFSTWQCW